MLASSRLVQCCGLSSSPPTNRGCAQFQGERRQSSLSRPSLSLQGERCSQVGVQQMAAVACLPPPLLACTVQPFGTVQPLHKWCVWTANSCKPPWSGLALDALDLPLQPGARACLAIVLEVVMVVFLDLRSRTCVVDRHPYPVSSTRNLLVATTRDSVSANMTSVPLTAVGIQQ